MIHLLYTVILSEMALILTLIFKNPLRKLVLMGLDRVKRGKGPVVGGTVAATVLVVLLSSVYSIVKIQQRTAEAGLLNPTDQVLMARHLLEASLMGFVLFLALMIDRLHHYIRELRLLRKTMLEASKKQSRGIDDGGEVVRGYKEEINSLNAKMSSVEAELSNKEKAAKAAEAEAEALRKQSEGFLMEYDRLLADNQNLRSQLDSINPTSSSH